MGVTQRKNKNPLFRSSNFTFIFSNAVNRLMLSPSFLLYLLLLQLQNKQL